MWLPLWNRCSTRSRQDTCGKFFHQKYSIERWNFGQYRFPEYAKIVRIMWLVFMKSRFFSLRDKDLYTCHFLLINLENLYSNFLCVYVKLWKQESPDNVQIQKIHLDFYQFSRTAICIEKNWKVRVISKFLIISKKKLIKSSWSRGFKGLFKNTRKSSSLNDHLNWATRLNRKIEDKNFSSYYFWNFLLTLD